MDRYMQFIERAAGQRPEITAQLGELGALYTQKLWHQLTERLEGLIEEEPFQRGGFLVELYQNFIAGSSLAVAITPSLGVSQGAYNGVFLGCYAFQFGWIWQATATWVNMLNWCVHAAVLRTRAALF